MPVYNMLCDTKIGGCGFKFFTESLMRDLEKHLNSLVCPNCREHDPLHQVYSAPIVHMPKTIGSLADKNMRILSQDCRDEISKKHNEYKNQNNWQVVDGKIRHKKELEAEERKSVQKTKKKPISKKKKV